MIIKPYIEVVKDTAADIKSYQVGEKIIVKTNKPYLDEFGITSSSVVVIAGPSFTGKTMELEELKANIMSDEVNLKANNFVWLSNSLEMTNMATLLRGLSAHLDLPKKEILSREFTETEARLAKEYIKSIADNRFYINETPPTPEEFIDSCRQFLSEHTDKDLVVIDYDHSALTRAKTLSKKMAMDDLYEGVNELKKEFKNSLFIFISQFNRESLSRIAEKDNNMRAQRSDLYQSDALFQVADVVYALQVPHKVGVDQYRLVMPKYYEHLTEHFGDFNKDRTKVSFKTYGRIFIEVLKNRFAEGFVFRDLFVKQVEDEGDYYANAKKAEESKFIDLEFV
jgi:replicative DNA helicase